MRFTDNRNINYLIWSARTEIGTLMTDDQIIDDLMNFYEQLSLSESKRDSEYLNPIYLTEFSYKPYRIHEQTSKPLVNYFEKTQKEIETDWFLQDMEKRTKIRQSQVEKIRPNISQQINTETTAKKFFYLNPWQEEADPHRKTGYWRGDDDYGRRSVKEIVSPYQLVYLEDLRLPICPRPRAKPEPRVYGRYEGAPRVAFNREYLNKLTNQQKELQKLNAMRNCKYIY